MDALIIWVVIIAIGLAIWVGGIASRRKEKVRRAVAEAHRQEHQEKYAQQRAQRQIDRDQERANAKIAEFQGLANEAKSQALYLESKEGGVRPRGRLILEKMGWREFEVLLGEYVADLGFQSEITPPGGDRGVDVVGREPTTGQIVLVAQAKHTPRLRSNVGRPVIQQLIGTASVAGASKALIATTGRLTKDAQHYATEYSAALSPSQPELIVAERDLIENWIDGLDDPRFRGLIDPLVDRLAHDTYTGNLAAEKARQKAILEADRPHCPVCGSVMVLRSGRRGEFFGCPRYPECKGTRPLPKERTDAARIDPWKTE